MLYVELASFVTLRSSRAILFSFNPAPLIIYCDFPPVICELITAEFETEDDEIPDPAIPPKFAVLTVLVFAYTMPEL